MIALTLETAFKAVGFLFNDMGVLPYYVLEALRKKLFQDKCDYEAVTHFYLDIMPAISFFCKFYLLHFHDQLRYA